MFDIDWGRDICGSLLLIRNNFSNDSPVTRIYIYSYP